MGNDRGGERRGGGGRGLNPNYFLPKPVKVGDEIDVTIDATAAKGDGLAKKDGFVIFVKDAKQGQTVKVRITDVRARFAVGEIIDGASASPSEASPQ
ncbi:MAG: TRAM domain-containing protein [Candidatus Micrarchaeota archaeon]|nr:TRAM domain-containing protein [Candidatus Micrarchaeota archaeon]MDE1859768.1 TRAM domain-containing protein [Candidatus Micrarchaeota archaeon]